jgi:MFS family permease
MRNDGASAEPEARTSLGSAPVVGVNLASFALIFESSALTVALPALARDWQASPSALRWIADASLLTTALLLMFAGRWSDDTGTRRVMRLGLIGVGACSLAAAAAPSAAWLIGIRLVQGVFAALVIPGTLGLLRLFIPDENDRLRAMTWWTGISLAGSAIGPIVGGLIVDAGRWRGIFALPALLVCAAWWCLRERKGDVRAPSGCEGEADRGHPHRAEGDAAPASTDRRRERPVLLPLALLKDRAFLASNLASASVYFAVYGLSFALATSLPDALSSSSLSTGIYMTPPAIMMLVLASPVARVGTGDRAWWIAAIGATMCAIGLVLLSTLIEHATPLTLISTTAFIGVGFALSLGPLNALMMARPSPEDSNAASAFSNVTARAAGFAAIALGGMLTISALMALVGAGTAGWMSIVCRRQRHAGAQTGHSDRLGEPAIRQ